jgi:hypothetical protein
MRPGRSRAPRQRAHDDEGERGPVCGMVWAPGPRRRAGLPTGSVLSELPRDFPCTCRHRTAAPPSGPIGDLGQAGRPLARSTVRSSPVEHPDHPNAVHSRGATTRHLPVAPSFLSNHPSSRVSMVLLIGRRDHALAKPICRRSLPCLNRQQPKRELVRPLRRQGGHLATGARDVFQVLSTAPALRPIIRFALPVTTGDRRK